MYSFEIDGNLARALTDEKARERRKTIVAASLGLPLGLAFSIGIPLLTLPQVGPALMEIVAAAFVAQPLAANAQQRLRNGGWLMFSEVLGYVGAGLGVVGALCKVPGARIPLAFLAAQYEDQGRYPLALRFYEKANSAPEGRKRSFGYLEHNEQAELLQLLFNSGEYEKCSQLGEKLLVSTSQAYYDERTDVNQIALFNVHSLLVAQFYSRGQCEKAKAIWSNLKALREFSAEADKAMIAHCYNSMARAGLTVEDYTAALRFAVMARDCFERAEISDKLLEGDIALNLATCYLKLGQIRQAEFEANNVLQDWRVVLSPYAARMGQAYYLLGMLEQQRGEFQKAAEQLGRARSVLRERSGVHSLQLLPVLVDLRQCLHGANRSAEANTITQEINQICEAHDCKPAACAAPVEDMTPPNDVPDVVDIYCQLEQMQTSASASSKPE